MSSQTPQPERRPSGSVGELGRAARGGAVTFVGAAASSGFGFLFSLLLARLFGPGDAGAVLQTVALFTIAVSVARLGMDTTAVWLLPGLRATAPEQVPGAVRFLLVCSGVAGAVVALAWLPGRTLWSDPGAPVVGVVDAVVWLLPVAAMSAVALACTRAFGGILAFNAVDNILTPALRPLLLVVAHLAGAGAVGAALGWAVPTVVALAVTSLVMERGVARLRADLPAGVRAPRWPDAALRRKIAGYSGLRTFSAAMEQSVVWIGVLVVGLLVGDAAAGVYGSAARFVAAGVVVATALRIVVAPRFSALLAEQRHDDVARLYVVTARWILLFGAPVYLTLAFFSPTVLAWLGEGFAEGVGALTILSLGSIVVLAAGNVQALLLMSGRSGLAAVNKAVVLAVNVIGMLLLVPGGGIEAAAAVWAVSVLLDTVLASVQVARATGITLSWVSVARVGLAVAACVALPAWAVTSWWGQGEGPLLVSIAVGGLALVGYLVVDRRVLHLQELRALLRR